MTEHQRQFAALQAFLSAAALGDRAAYVASLEALDWPTAWIDVFRGLVVLGRVHPETRRVFHDQWMGQLGKFITYPPGGSRLRWILADHLDLFVSGLRILLPPFEGEAPQVIYRGQSVEEHRAGVVGVSWSPYPMLAEAYARDHRLNDGETVVLASFFPADAIIGVINFGELIVDPRRITKPMAIYKGASKFRPVKEGETYIDQCETLMLYDLIPIKTGQVRAEKD